MGVVLGADLMALDGFGFRQGSQRMRLSHVLRLFFRR